jgi:hypothetical protein
MPEISAATPKSSVAAPDQSESNGTSTPSVSVQAACDQTESREIANGRMPAADSSSPLSRRSRSSLVQVGDQSNK